MLRALLVSLISFQAIAGPPPVSIKGQDGTKLIPKWNLQVPYNQATNLGGIDALIETGNGNLLANSSFEASTFSSGWTILGGVGCASTTADVIGGKKSVSCSAVGSVNDVASQFVTPALSTVGRNWEVGIYAAASDVGFSACAVVGGVETQCKTIDVAVNPTYYYFNTPVPNSTAFGIKIKSTTASLKSLKFDEAYVGPARNLAVIPAGGQFVGSVAFGTDCNWSRTASSSFGNFAADATCTTTVVQGAGSVSVVGATRPAIQVNNTLPGTYQVVLSGNLYKNNANTQSCVYRITDGTNVLGQGAALVSANNSVTPGFSGEWKYTAPASSVVFDVQTTGDGAAIACDIVGLAPNFQNKLSVYYFPSVDQQAVRADQTNFGWTDGGAITVTGTTTNPTKGTIVRDKIWYKRSGENLDVRLEYKQSTAGTVGSGDYLFSVPSICTIDTSKLVLSTTIGANSGTDSSVVGVAGGGVASVASATGYVSVYSSSAVRIVVRDTGSAVTQALGSAYYTFANSALSFGASFSVPCIGWTENQKAPVITNSVTSKYAGNKPFIDAAVTNAGTPAFSGIFDGFISSITDNGVGDSTLTFSAAYSAAPRCTCNAVENVAAPDLSCVLKSVTTTTVRVFTTSAGAAADKDFTILCLGPR